jgi:hypothetical protein
MERSYRHLVMWNLDGKWNQICMQFNGRDRKPVPLGHRKISEYAIQSQAKNISMRLFAYDL